VPEDIGSLFRQNVYSGQRKTFASFRIKHDPEKIDELRAPYNAATKLTLLSKKARIGLGL
jgi:hypothetical protein